MDDVKGCKNFDRERGMCAQCSRPEVDNTKFYCYSSCNVKSEPCKSSWEIRKRIIGFVFFTAAFIASIIIAWIYDKRICNALMAVSGYMWVYSGTKLISR